MSIMMSLFVCKVSNFLIHKAVVASYIFFIVCIRESVMTLLYYVCRLFVVISNHSPLLTMGNQTLTLPLSPISKRIVIKGLVS